MRNEKEYKSFLDEESSYTVERSDNDRSSKSKGSVLSRQTKLIIVLAAFLAVIIPIYIFVLIPKLSSNDPSKSDEYPEPHHGEVLLSGGSIGMMPMLAEKDISTVDIQNKVTVKDGDSTKDIYENWKIFYDSEKKLWGIENYTNISYDSSALITILGYFTQMRVQDRLEFTSADEINMSAYGFDEASMPTHYTITTVSGKTYTVTMGNQTPTGTGYYAYFTSDKGEIRPTVYIISNYYASLINGSVFSLMAPTVTQLLNIKDYVPTTFAIYKGLEPYFEIKKLEGDALNETGKVSHLYTKVNGVVHEYDASANYSNLLYEVLQKGINGSKVVYAKPDNLEDISDEVLLSFGIDKKAPNRQLLFEAQTMYASNESHLAKQWVMFSEKTKDLSGNDIYYAWNVSFDIIVEVPAISVEFIEYSLDYYYESYIFLTPFYAVDSITIDSTKLPKGYTDSGFYALRETFKLTISEDKKLENIIIESLGTPPIAPSSKVTGIKNFGFYYNVLLSLSTQVEVPEDVLSKIDLTNPHITITVKTISGKVHTMNFYLYNSRHAYYTLDGLGVSYVRYSDITKLLSATHDLIEGNLVSTDYTAQKPGDSTVDTLEPTPTGISTTEIVLIVVLVSVILVGGGIAAYILIKSNKKNDAKTPLKKDVKSTPSKNKKKK